MSESVNAVGWAARDPSGVLSPFKFSRPAAARHVHFKVLYCGICHSDLHSIKNEWGNAQYPIIPGHEIVGVVTSVGPSVTKFSPGDKVGVGKLILVGAPEKPLELPAFPLIMGRKTVAGSIIGGIKETQEMIDFAAKHNIVADVEIIPIDYVNTAMERLAKADVKYRFVIDVGNTLKAE
ncbi:cinnamyl-alcohol dehydrogenase [Salvia divinorum]|uniref:Cinnamyl-alcohol dehydrogenase n=1 Tax=Salvia divinorum TaxID=28513 RepID=A0ABD1GGK7_SALDI